MVYILKPKAREGGGLGHNASADSDQLKGMAEKIVEGRSINKERDRFRSPHEESASSLWAPS